MSAQTIQITPELRDYILQTCVRESALLAELRAETAELPGARMQISPEQGQLMTLLVQLLGARRAIEIGTFTGYSALCIAAGLPDDGQLIACDVSAEWTAIGQRYWQRAGLGERIDLRIGPGRETLTALLDSGEAGSFDFAFLDADKESYPTYYELVLQLVRPGGLIAIDNALWSGRVLEDPAETEETRAIQEINARVGKDERVACSLIPIGDGLLLARKA